jgi:hypothetical protein
MEAQAKSRNATEPELEKFLLANDAMFYTEGWTIKKAREFLLSEQGLKCSSGRLRVHADKHCQFWKQRSRPEWSACRALNERDWSRIRQWIDANTEFIRNAYCVEFVARVMRTHGLKVSPTLLLNSCTFTSVWKEKDREVLQGP